ncbi:MAG: hypothetical protein IT548_18070 [Alphaproteobacteria bacterium]|nr:hypothetical protein [Alphaproteobacteria bacterium]
MTADIDVWRAANLLVKQHGTNAPEHAAKRAEELLAQGARTGAITMQRVADACQTLVSEAAPGCVRH